MRDRKDLNRLLISILGSDNVYFQPPESIKLKYPALVYTLYDISTKEANDKGDYAVRVGYQITSITKDPDDPVIEKLIALPYCRFNRSFKADNLNHTVFLLYF